MFKAELFKILNDQKSQKLESRVQLIANINCYILYVGSF